MEILRLTDRTEVALPEATPNGIFATALSLATPATDA